MTRLKTFDAVMLKSGTADGLEEGQFEALVSVFNVKDTYGDVVRPGAFVDTLAQWKASGNPIPVIWSHGYFDSENHIGYLLDAAEKTIGDKSGLWVKGQLDMDPEDTRARKVSRLLKGRRVTQFSFSYDVLEGGPAKSEEFGDYYSLDKLGLYEVGPCLIGVNKETELLAAKALADFGRELASEVKAGRVLSAKNEGLLRDAYESIGSVLGALDSSSEDGKAKRGQPDNDEEPPAKSDDPDRRTSPVETSELQLLELGLQLELSQ